MATYVFGDSHSHYIFSRVSNVKVDWLGPWTMHRVGRDGASFITKHVELKDEDAIILVFGEIDVRCHLVRIAQQQNRDIDDLIKILVDNYIASIKKTLGQIACRIRTFILGAVPPMDAIVPNTVTPTYGSLRERTSARRKLNDALRKACAQAGFHYIAVPKHYEAFDGSMKLRLSDGHAHIAKDHAYQACKRIGRTIGSNLEFRRPGLMSRVRWTLIRRSAIKRRDAASLWLLGENENDDLR